MAVFLIEYACGHWVEKDGFAGPEQAARYQKAVTKDKAICTKCENAQDQKVFDAHGKTGGRFRSEREPLSPPAEIERKVVE